MQKELYKSLLDPNNSMPNGLKIWNGSDPAIRFAIYRNNVMVSLIDALAENCPVLVSQVGTTFFRAMATEYIRQQLPVTPVLSNYGSTLPDWLEKFPPLNDWPWLADVGRLELLFIESLHAADGDVLTDSKVYQEIDPAEMVITLHPSVRIFGSSYAVFSLWAAHQNDEQLVLLDPFQAEQVILFRCDDDVLIAPLSMAEIRFIDALQSGNAFTDALGRAIKYEQKFEPLKLLSHLQQYGLVLSLSCSQENDMELYKTVILKSQQFVQQNVIAILARISLAAIFWLSGQTKIEGLNIDILGNSTFQLGIPHITSSTVALFASEYTLPLLSPELAAMMAASMEHIFPFLLLIGLATRFSALALMLMTLVIQIFVYHDAWPTHATWIALQLYLISYGGKQFSLDYLIHRYKSKLNLNSL